MLPNLPEHCSIHTMLPNLPEHCSLSLLHCIVFFVFLHRSFIRCQTTMCGDLERTNTMRSMILCMMSMYTQMTRSSSTEINSSFSLTSIPYPPRFCRCQHIL